MRPTLTILFMSFLSSFLFGSTKPDPGASDKWAIAKADLPDGGTGIYRYLREKPDQWKAAPLSEEVSISWKYSGSLPDDTTNKRMNELEDALEALLVSPDSYLVLVITVGGLREWCFYTQDYDAFMKTLNMKLAGKPQFPIAIEHSSDPDWTYWQAFIDKLSVKQ